ncbi:MAG: hypothetical protein OI74_09905 [Gammaproteobacteria bacterium (ex Lamellibrachia satsuma)]|nr:MAG: hypothetical protein HPY30_13080 [Gammaproteobacteria bacterium (ex Lamellibrachia satsuma)]RRS32742.1 MAG: hypothetical protein OI74_09905 [Gammaproteobacteria bacterium (ex Lamellibrachia satsuma)]RRS36206.1 MAG: hypothetical protein NV67_08245 [Gammaproteobacteria bacterium (ex Lamellibrachia satsuma)]
MPVGFSRQSGLAMLRPGILWLLFLIPLFVSGLATAEDEDDAFLSAIAEEASKVEQRGDVGGQSEQAPLVEGGPTQEEFEANLKSRYLGSFTFYRKLPGRSQEEIYLDYKSGASIGDIRKKIMDRFLHR